MLKIEKKKKETISLKESSERDKTQYFVPKKFEDESCNFLEIKAEKSRGDMKNPWNNSRK